MLFIIQQKFGFKSFPHMKIITGLKKQFIFLVVEIYLHLRKKLTCENVCKI